MANEIEAAQRLALSDHQYGSLFIHQTYCNSLCFEAGWEAGVVYARKELGGILTRLVAEARAAAADSDNISPTWIIEVLGPLAESAS